MVCKWLCDILCAPCACSTYTICLGSKKPDVETVAARDAFIKGEKPWQKSHGADIAHFTPTAQSWSTMHRRTVGSGDSMADVVNKAILAFMPMLERLTEALLHSFNEHFEGLPLGDPHSPLFRLRIVNRGDLLGRRVDPKTRILQQLDVRMKHMRILEADENVYIPPKLSQVPRGELIIADAEVSVALNFNGEQVKKWLARRAAPTRLRLSGRGCPSRPPHRSTFRSSPINGMPPRRGVWPLRTRTCASRRASGGACTPPTSSISPSRSQRPSSGTSTSGERPCSTRLNASAAARAIRCLNVLEGVLNAARASH